MNTGVSLADQRALLLQNVVEENRLLRELMTNTITTSENAVRNINKMDIIARTASGRRVWQAGQSVQEVPKSCSVSKL